MARLIIVIDIDVDPTLEDPHDVATEFFCQGPGDMNPPNYADVVPTFVSAEWET